jgi:hypothetical protein
MKKNTIILFCLLSIIMGTAQESAKQIFSSPKLTTEIQNHKTVAILPFKANISYKRKPENYSSQTIKDEEAQLSYSLQSGMYTYLLRKSDNYFVSIQDIEKTNTLLKQNKAFENIDEFTADTLAKILGVDAVIKCSYAYEKTRSEGGAIATAILFGSGKVATGELRMGIYNGKDGELLWRFYKQMNEDVFSSANALIERMMRKVSRNFPYQKD